MKSIYKKYDKRKIKILALTLLFIIGLLFIMLSTPSDDYKLKFGQVYALNDSWTIEEPSGDLYTIDLPVYTDVQKGQTVHASKVLPSSFVHNKTLRIRSSMQNIQVKLDDVIIFDNTQYNRDNLPHTPVASAWFLIDIPGNSDGSVLDVYISSDITAMSGRVNEIYYGSRSDLIAELLTRNEIGVIVIFFVFSVAIYTLIVSIFIKHESIIRLQYICLFSFAIGLWMVAEMDFIQLFVSHNYLVGSISYLMLPLASLFFVLFIYEAALKKYGPILKTFTWLISLYLITSILLQLIFGIDYIVIIPIFILLLSITILTIIVLLVLEIHNSSKYAAKYLAFIFVMLITQVLESIMFFIGDFNNVSSLSSLGIMLFLLLVVIDTIIYLSRIIQKEAESKYLRVIAYIDPLTQGLNRAAFERDIDKLLKDGKKTPFRLSMFDMNGLKKINDQYGHEVGDQALKDVYKQLKEVFNQDASCYRIGGDEFMVIHTNTSEDDFKHLLDQFRLGLVEHGSSNKYVLKVACGSEIYRFEESFGSFKHLVDKLMYEEKGKGKIG